jgi:hypothetical protein
MNKYKSVGWRQEPVRHSLAAKGIVSKRGMFVSNKNETLNEYINRNLKKNRDDNIKDFWTGVKDVLLHPVTEGQKDFQSYEEAAGHGRIPLAKDNVGRAEEAGAGIVGRVVSQANMEPMLDHGKDRTFREDIIDLEFGRRLK